MQKQFDVLTIGDLCVDLIATGTTVVPEFGQKEKLVNDYALGIRLKAGLCLANPWKSVQESERSVAG